METTASDTRLRLALALREYTYQPFGAATTSGSSTTDSFGFTGREADGTGLHYYRARYYDARLQRFIAEDPMGVAGGINLFAYAANQPIGYSDPLGLKPSSGGAPANGAGPTAGGPGPNGDPNGNPKPNPPDSHQPKKPSCWRSNFTFARNAAHTPLVDLLGIEVPNYVRHIPGVSQKPGQMAASVAGITAATARAIGTVTAWDAAKAFWTNGGCVANLSPMQVVASTAANSVIAAGAGWAVYESGAAIGAAAYATGQTIAGNCQ